MIIVVMYLSGILVLIVSIHPEFSLFIIDWGELRCLDGDIELGHRAGTSRAWKGGRVRAVGWRGLSRVLVVTAVLCSSFCVQRRPSPGDLNARDAQASKNPHWYEERGSYVGRKTIGRKQRRGQLNGGDEKLPRLSLSAI